jgi:hypothetical protein
MRLALVIRRRFGAQMAERLVSGHGEPLGGEPAIRTVSRVMQQAVEERRG